MSLSKGTRRERELVNLFYDAGFGVTRVPKSGGGTKRELPDILAGTDDISYAIEAKSSGGDPIYLDSREVVALVHFARKFGARPKVGVRFDREDWYFFHPDDLHKTPEKRNFRIKKERAREGKKFEDLLMGRVNRDRRMDVIGAVSAGSLSVDDAVKLLAH